MSHDNYETRQILKKLRLIDDDLFKVVVEDVPTCRELLVPFIGDKGLDVIDVKSQVTEVGLKREIRIDAKCVLEDGSVCNIEVQKSNRNDDIRRTRFHTSILTVNSTEKGIAFESIPDVIAIYISEYDVLGNGQRITYVKRCQKIGNTYVPVDDGELIIFANTLFTDEEINNKEELSDVDRLLMLFNEDNIFYDERFPHISERVKYFKEEKGSEIMCAVVEEYGEKKLSQGISQGIKSTAKNMKEEGIPESVIIKVTGLTQKEIQEL